ncbi:MAG: DNA/RNA non-specific endonuclease [Bacteroidota bacterium]|nr:DNA/RNA non-specific endonuclease [Bacteroidota bacterium]
MKFFIVIYFLISAQVIAVKATDYLPIPSKDLVRHAYYTLSYNEQYEQANWVYYTLTDSMVINGGEERSNSFRMDKLVATGSAKSSDYTKSGYDRGHLCPAADMGFNPVAMEESFLMSNISPQTPDFNRGVWKELETTVREWAIKEHKLVVATGPVFLDNKGSIGKDKVLVPGYFFKIIYDATDEPKLIAFVLPNAKSDRPLTDFAVTTDEAEKLTGFDFFSQLPDDLETKLESHVELAGWFEGYATEAILAEQSQAKEAPAKFDLKFYSILILAILLVVIFVTIKSRKKR